MVKVKQESDAARAPVGQEKLVWLRSQTLYKLAPNLYAHVCFTWPPQILALLCQCRAAPIKAVAPWAGGAILLEGIFRTCWLLAITELLQVTLVLHGTTQLTSWLHLVTQRSLLWGRSV